MAPWTGIRDRAVRFARAWRLVLRIMMLMLRAQLEYRVDFLLQIGVGILWQTSIIVFASVLLTRFNGMAGWPADAVLLIVAVRMLGHGLYVLCFGRVFELTYLVQDGKIDGYLLRPMPVHRQVQLAEFPSNALGDILVGVSLFIAAVLRLHTAWTPEKALYLGAAVCGAMLVEAAILTAFSAAAFHYPGSYAWSSWSIELLETFGNYPLSILPGLMRAALTWVLPLAFVAYFPAATLTGRTAGLGVPEALAAGSPAVGLGLYIASRLIWNASLRRYSGVNG
ncbi:MAG TPA: ABC-2 family transporter protein [Actinocrinis sp.]|jgi:ABC-2 type transport system permease protein